MEKYALKDLPLDKFLACAEHLVVEGAEGKYVYNLVMTEPDGVRIKGENYWISFEDGKIASGEGHSDDPDATVFTVLQGGLDTLTAMQVHGMKAAMNAMMLGYITASNLKAAEAWFKLLKTGEEAVLAALKAVDVEITDPNLDIYAELQLA
jgi:hypothetical protein